MKKKESTVSEGKNGEEKQKKNPCDALSRKQSKTKTGKEDEREEKEEVEED